MKNELGSLPGAKLKFISCEFIIIEVNTHMTACITRVPGLICISLDVSADKIVYISPNNAGEPLREDSENNVLNSSIFAFRPCAVCDHFNGAAYCHLIILMMVWTDLAFKD